MVCQNCSRSFTSVKAWEYHDCKPTPSSYTLAEIETLAREFINEQERSGAYPTGLQLVLSLYLTWLAQREKERRDGS